MRYRAVNPATGVAAEEYPLLGDAELDRRLDAAVTAWRGWSGEALDRRAHRLRGVADDLESRAEALARLMATEMGKPLAQGIAEARKCAWVCRYYAEHAPAFLAEAPRESDGSSAFTLCQPLGPVLAIMPWNFPLWQFFRFAAPALMAGNVALLKHAPNTPGCALAIEALFRDRGFPPGVVTNLFIDHDQAARAIGDPRVAGVTLTGSTRAGSEVAAAAGRHLKPMVMELGGSDPFIVLADADVEAAVRVGVESRCLNNGQSCIAAKRFVVHRAVHDRVVEGLVEAMRRRRTGDPLDPTTELGPLAREDLRATLDDQVRRSLAMGARASCGGQVPAGPGFFYPPTVLVGPPDDSPALEEELFGPVAAVIAVEDDEQAISRANATEYGLGASLWTADPERARRFIPRIDAGSVFVNGMVKSDPRLPFGGIKRSGFGRELAREGLLEFVNVKTVWIG